MTSSNQSHPYTKNERRRVVFHSLVEVVADIESLQRRHRAVGQWSLAQICGHIADTLHASIDGFDLRVHAWKRALLAKPLYWWAMRFGLPTGVTVDPALEPPVEVRLDETLGALHRAVDRYAKHTGPVATHPIFGRLNRRQWDRLHCVHAAHHLSFVWPEDQVRRSESGW